MRFLAFINEIYKLFKDKNERINANLLSLKTDKPYFFQFSTKNSSLTNLNIDDNKVIPKIPNMKFRRIKVENTMPWNNHINMSLPKISAACLVIRMVKPFMSLETENDKLCIVSLVRELWNNFLEKFLIYYYYI
jgi:hypothetical protein